MIDGGKRNILGILMNAVDYEAAVEFVIRAARERQGAARRTSSRTTYGRSFFFFAALTAGRTGTIVRGISQQRFQDFAEQDPYRFFAARTHCAAEAPDADLHGYFVDRVHMMRRVARRYHANLRSSFGPCLHSHPPRQEVMK
jgi:hypothetical protein